MGWALIRTWTGCYWGPNSTGTLTEPDKCRFFQAFLPTYGIAKINTVELVISTFVALLSLLLSSTYNSRWRLGLCYLRCDIHLCNNWRCPGHHHLLPHHCHSCGETSKEYKGWPSSTFWGAEDCSYEADWLRESNLQVLWPNSWELSFVVLIMYCALDVRATIFELLLLNSYLLKDVFRVLHKLLMHTSYCTVSWILILMTQVMWCNSS